MKNYKNEKRDFYKILGVDSNVDTSTLKKVYRKLVIEHHPDKNENVDDSKIKEINEAYTILSDENERRAYDNSRRSGFETFDNFTKKRRGTPNFGGFNFNFDDDWRSGDWFAGTRQSRRQQTYQQAPKPKGSNLRVPFEIDAMDTHKEIKKKIQYRRNRRCDTCSGTGGFKTTICGVCEGSGIATQMNGFGEEYVGICTNCRGSGSISTKGCVSCNGSGHIKETVLVDIVIPKFSTKGKSLVFNGYGNESSNGGDFGDLIVEIEKVISPDFQIEDDLSLIKHIDIPFYDFILGTKLTIHTPANTLEVSIDSNDSKYLIKNKGIPLPNSDKFSDIILVINPTYKDLNEPVIKKIKEIKTILEGQENVE